jgi:hypothetical protein
MTSTSHLARSVANALAYANANKRKKRKMQFRENAECGCCYEVYKAEDFITCPNCDAVSEIKQEKKEEETA